jgi:iron complex transport system permease protein
MKGRVILGLVLVSIAALVVGVVTGPVTLPAGEIWDALKSPGAPAAPIVRDLRMPRVLLAFVVGGGLGLCGAALQALVRNPLADPYLLGLSGGAGLGAVVAIAAGLGGAWGVPMAAFAGAIAALLLVYRLSLVQGRRLDSRVLLLAGVIVSALCGALMSAIMALSSSATLRNAFLWLLGGFSGASWPALGIFLAYAVIPLIILFSTARWLDLLALGEESARHLGLDVDRARLIVYLSTGLLTAASVATAGIIGFVGLVVPHAARRLLGPLHRPLLPAVFFGSGAFLVLADALARTVARPVELPVGVVTAIVGVPLFALLLRRTLA